MFNRKRRQRNAKIQIQIWEQTNGEVTHFVAGGSTGGTISGVGVWKISWLKQMMMMRVMFVWWKQTFVGKFLKSKNPLVKCVLADPEGSIFYDFFTSRKVLTVNSWHQKSSVWIILTRWWNQRSSLWKEWARAPSRAAWILLSLIRLFCLIMLKSPIKPWLRVKILAFEWFRA